MLLKIGVIFFDSIIERIQSVLPVSFHLLCPNGIAAHNETFSTFLRQHLRYRFVKKGHLQNTLFQQALNLRLGQGRNVVEINYHPQSGWFDEGPSKGPPPCGRGLKPPEVLLLLVFFLFLLVADVVPNNGLV